MNPPAPPHRRARIRAAVWQRLHGLPQAELRAAEQLPFIDVSTPDESPAEEGGYVDGRSEVDISVSVAAFAATEDGVDELLADVERKLFEDTTLAGTATALSYEGYQLDADEDALVGIATWVARVETYEV